MLTMTPVLLILVCTSQYSLLPKGKELREMIKNLITERSDKELTNALPIKQINNHRERKPLTCYFHFFFLQTALLRSLIMDLLCSKSNLQLKKNVLLKYTYKNSEHLDEMLQSGYTHVTTIQTKETKHLEAYLVSSTYYSFFTPQRNRYSAF